MAGNFVKAEIKNLTVFTISAAIAISCYARQIDSNALEILVINKKTDISHT